MKRVCIFGPNGFYKSQEDLLQEEIDRLNAELENWRKRGATVVANVAGLVKEIDQLKADNAKLLKTLKEIHSLPDDYPMRAAISRINDVFKEVQHD